MHRGPRHPFVSALSLPLVALGLSCAENVTQPRLTLTELTVGVPLTDRISRGGAKVYSAGVSPGVLYKVSVTGLTDDADFHVYTDAMYSLSPRARRKPRECASAS